MSDSCKSCKSCKHNIDNYCELGIFAGTVYGWCPLYEKKGTESE